MIRRPPRSTLSSSSAASDVYKRQVSTQSTGVAEQMPEEVASASLDEIRELRLALSRKLEHQQADQDAMSDLRDKFVQDARRIKQLADRLVSEEADKTASLTRLGTRMCALKNRVKTYLDSTALITHSLPVQAMPLANSAQLLSGCEPTAVSRQPAPQSPPAGHTLVGPPPNPTPNGDAVVGSAEPHVGIPAALEESVGEVLGGSPNPFQPQSLSLIHISEPTRLLSISYAVFCLKKKKKNQTKNTTRRYAKIEHK
eukprot:TRINITY_DN20832_c0_g1_i1.p1 TRINITY_DN20832_c0_g1~~TRINITY_DN20832_c0_g1_i1.p1  ORF type:complete len:256 (-),score=56.59 TRINITY_DN20832_c0_g1_i1:60-827(-)